MMSMPTMPMISRLHLNKSIDTLDRAGRTLHGGLTVEQAAQVLIAHQGDLCGYLEATWSVYEGDGFPPLAHQVAVKVRRLRKLAQLIGRNVVRVVQTRTGYHALLAR